MALLGFQFLFLRATIKCAKVQGGRGALYPPFRGGRFLVGPLPLDGKKYSLEPFWEVLYFLAHSSSPMEKLSVPMCDNNRFVHLRNREMSVGGSSNPKRCGNKSSSAKFN